MADPQSPENTSVPAQAGATECQEASAAGKLLLLPEATSPEPVPTIDALDAAAAHDEAARDSAEVREVPACQTAECAPAERHEVTSPEVAEAGSSSELPEGASPEAPAADGPRAGPVPATEPVELPKDEPAGGPCAEAGECEAGGAVEAAGVNERPKSPEASRREEPAARPEVPPAPSFASETARRSQRAGMMALLKLDKVDEDDTFRLRVDDEIDSLATSIAKLGQLFPVELRFKPPDRFQVVCGFRRVAALRLLKRERVIARVYTDLSDEDALQLALADLLESRSVGHDELVALREKLRGENRLPSSVADTLDRAISPPGDTLCPETVDGPEEEVDLDELAQDLLGRLAAVNQDLALVVELWNALEPGLRDALLEQLGYPEQLGSYLRGLR